LWRSGMANCTQKQMVPTCYCSSSPLSPFFNPSKFPVHRNPIVRPN
jgi:hypothetical protein